MNGTIDDFELMNAYTEHINNVYQPTRPLKTKQQNQHLTTINYTIINIIDVALPIIIL